MRSLVIFVEGVKSERMTALAVSLEESRHHGGPGRFRSVAVRTLQLDVPVPGILDRSIEVRLVREWDTGSDQREVGPLRKAFTLPAVHIDYCRGTECRVTGGKVAGVEQIGRGKRPKPDRSDSRHR